MRLQVQSLASLSGLRSGVALSCGVGHRLGSDPALLWLWLWLWCRLAAVVLIRSLAWESPHALKRKKENFWSISLKIELNYV